MRLVASYCGLLLFLLLGGCDRPAEQNDAPEATLATPPGLSLLVHPYDAPSRLIARFQPLCDYLSAHIGRPVRLELARSYVDQIKRISSGQADLAYMGPTPYLRAQDHYLAGQAQRLVPLAAEARHGVASYRSVIVTRADGPLRKLSDLRGHSLAFGAPHSYSSHYVPRTLLAAAGLGLTDLQDYAFLGRHERVALAVLHTDFDAGGLRESVARSYLGNSPGLRIIGTSPPLPPHLIVARPGLDNGLVRRIRQLLLHAEDDFDKAMQAMGDGTGFVPVDPALFNSARAVIEAVEATTEVPDGW